MIGSRRRAFCEALAAARLAPAYPGLALYTVAGNLDPDAWARRRRLTPLTESLNPAASAPRLAGVPQLHLVGTRDLQVPPYVLESFLAHMPVQDCVHVVRVDAAHAGPWEDTWRRALAEAPRCTSPGFATREANAPSR